MAAPPHAAAKVSGAHVLVVDDETGLRDMLGILFRREGYKVTLASGLREGLEAVTSAPDPFGLVVTDLMMPDGSGMDLLTGAKARHAATEVIVMTAHSSVETAILAMKGGAYDFITKPFATAELRALAQKALEKSDIVSENKRLRARAERDAPKDLLGQSAPMRAIVDLARRIAASKSTVLITGESGSGKERVARVIHELSDRAAKPFVVVNCGALPEALMESELFGHDKGAFTGATARHTG